MHVFKSKNPNRKTFKKFTAYCYPEIINAFQARKGKFDLSIQVFFKALELELLRDVTVLLVKLTIASEVVYPGFCIDYLF